MKKYLTKEKIQEIKIELEKILSFEERLKLIEIKEKFNLTLMDNKQDQIKIFHYVKNELENRFQGVDTNSIDYLLKTTYNSLIETDFNVSGSKNLFVWNYLQEKYRKELDLINDTTKYKTFVNVLTEFFRDNFITDYVLTQIFYNIDYLDTFLLENKKDVQEYETFRIELVKFLKGNDPQKLFYCIKTGQYKDLNRFYNIMNS